MDYLLLVVALGLIVGGAMLLTDGSVALARRLHIPEFIVGLTVVAVGTSMPEMAVSMISTAGGYGDMAIGNVVGSNIANALLILGVCSIFAPVAFTKSNIRRDIPLNIAVSIVLLVVAYTSGAIRRVEGILLLMGYVAMMFYSVRAERKAMSSEEQPAQNMSMWRVLLLIVAGLAGLIYGGDIFVESATNIAKAWGVSEAVIAITLVAVGTSLPELAASLASIFKGSPSLALGNVIGSNIANILLILGACSTVAPLKLVGVGMVDICVVVATSVLLLLSALFIGNKKITRFEGVVFLAIYAAYIYTLL